MAWYNASWTYRVKITIQNGKVDADLTNFPVYVNLANLPAGFHTNVNQTDARDIRVTRADGTTECAREIVSYVAASDTGELHFLADALANATDTDFYIYYGNSGATEPAADATYGSQNVWSDYAAVLHMTAAGNATQPDSTANGNDFTPNNMESGDKIAGKLTYALSLDGSDEYLTKSSAIVSAPAFTLSAWVKTSNSAAQAIVSVGSNTSGTRNILGLFTKYTTTRNIATIARAAGGTSYYAYSPDYSTTDFFLSHAVFAATNNRTIYQNGGNSGNDTTSVTPTGIDYTYIGKASAEQTTYFTGSLSEVRIRASVLTATWISTEYNNQSSPATFYTAGGEEVATSIKTVNGLAKASVKTVNGLAIASVKTINGLA